MINKVLSVVRHEPEQKVTIIRAILDDNFESLDKLSKAENDVFMKED